MMSEDAKKLIQEGKEQRARLDRLRRSEERARIAADKLLFQHIVLIYKKKAALKTNVVRLQTGRKEGVFRQRHCATDEKRV